MKISNLITNVFLRENPTSYLERQNGKNAKMKIKFEKTKLGNLKDI